MSSIKRMSSPSARSPGARERVSVTESRVEVSPKVGSSSRSLCHSPSVCDTDVSSKASSSSRSLFHTPSACDTHGWRKRLVEILDSKCVKEVVIVLIIVDLSCVVVNSILEHTDWLNPKYHEQGHAIAFWTKRTCITILSTLFVEQLLRIVAFGCKYLKQWMMVMDLAVVSISLLVETVAEPYIVRIFEPGDELLRLVMVLQLWKLAQFIFDICLAFHERREKNEMIIHAAIEEHEKKKGD